MDCMEKTRRKTHSNWLGILFGICIICIAIPGTGYGDAGDLLWEAYAGGSNFYNQYPVIFDDMVISVTDTSDGYIYATDLATGNKRYEIALNLGHGVNANPPLIKDGIAYILNNCMDIRTGKKIISSIKGDVYNAYYKNKLYQVRRDILYCLDAIAGKGVWNISVGSDYRFSWPTIYHNKVFIGSTDNNLYCLDTQNGDIVWTFETDGEIHTSCAVHDGKIYFGNDNHKVFCVDEKNGNMIWNADTSRPILSSPSIYNNKLYIGDYLGTTSSTLYCLSTETGTEIWKSDVTIRDYRSNVLNPVISNDEVFFGFCLDARTGQIQWDHTKLNAPVIINNKIIDYMPYKLYSYDTGHETRDDWPMLQHDLQRTGNYHYGRTELNYRYLQAKPLSGYSQYKLQIKEIYEDNDYVAESPVNYIVSDPAVASVNGDILTGLKNGRVVVSADYAGQHHAKTLFVITSPDGWESWENNTRELADFLGKDMFIKGDLVSVDNNDIDYYTFTLDADSRIQLVYLPEGYGLDTRIEIQNSAGENLLSTVSYNGLEQIIPQDLPAGTYYVKISCEQTLTDDSYCLGYTLVDDFVSQTSPLSLGETIQSTVYSQGDVVKFPFTIQSRNNMDILLSSLRPSGDFTLEMRNSHGEVMQTIETGKNPEAAFSLDLSPGSYALWVSDTHNLDNGHHPFTVSLQEGTMPYETESNDASTTPTSLGWDVQKKGILYNKDDQDYYAFSMDTAGFIRLDFAPEDMEKDLTHYKLTLFKESDQNIIDATICNDKETAFIETGLTAGHYFVKVEVYIVPHKNHYGYIPGYLLTLSESQNQNLEIEPNNTPGFANSFDAQSGKDARIHSASDLDYYAFSLSEESVVTIDFTADTTTADYVISFADQDGAVFYTKTSTDGEDITLERRLPFGDYYVKVAPGSDTGPNDFYHLTTTTTILSGIKTLMSITLSAEKEQISRGENLAVTAMGNYSDASRAQITNANWYTSNSGILAVDQTGLATGVSGGYADIYASFAGKAGSLTIQVGSGEIPVEQSYGNLILVAGGSGDAGDPLYESFQYLSDLIYSRFKNRLFRDADIYYMNAVSGPHDLDGDGFDDNIVDDTELTPQRLEDVIRNWAADRHTDGPLYIGMIDHGGIDAFKMGPGEILTANQLKGYIDGFQNETQRKVVVILEACKSGSFTDNLSTQAHPRVVVTSTDENDTYIGFKGRISFTQFFMDKILRGASVLASREDAETRLGDLGRPYSDMRPGIFQWPANTASEIYVGGNFGIGSEPPEIEICATDETILLSDASAKTLCAQVTSEISVKKVWATIVPPNYSPPAVGEDFETPDVGQQSLDLADPDKDGIFEGQFTGFTQPGEYRFYVYAANEDDLVTPSAPIIVQAEGSVAPGDVNGDSMVDLTDAIVGLKEIAGIKTNQVISGYSNSGADVNNDGTLGLHEPIFILRENAGINH